MELGLETGTPCEMQTFQSLPNTCPKCVFLYVFKLRTNWHNANCCFTSSETSSISSHGPILRDSVVEQQVNLSPMQSSTYNLTSCYCTKESSKRWLKCSDLCPHWRNSGKNLQVLVFSQTLPWHDSHLESKPETENWLHSSSFSLSVTLPLKQIKLLKTNKKNKRSNPYSLVPISISSRTKQPREQRYT